MAPLPRLRDEVRAEKETNYAGGPGWRNRLPGAEGQEARDALALDTDHASFGCAAPGASQTSQPGPPAKAGRGEEQGTSTRNPRRDPRRPAEQPSEDQRS